MTAPVLQFWFEYASTYSYPAACRVGRLAEAAGVDIAWRPFLLGPVFKRQGWSDSPFNLYPEKGRYMWRDLARICGRERLPLRHPSVFPRSGLLAARATLVAADEGWAAELIPAVYLANFSEDRDISDPAVLGAIIERLGRDAGRVLAVAGCDDVKARLRAQTEEAIGLGIFGAPSIVADGELFWGNDRLEEAIAWLLGQRPRLAT